MRTRLDDETMDARGESFGTNHRAYLQILPEATALGADKLDHITVSVADVSRAVYGKLPAIVSLRPALAVSAPRHDFDNFDALGPRTMALAHAEACHVMAAKRHPPMTDKVDGLRVHRDILWHEAMQLSRRGCLPGEPLTRIRFTKGHAGTAENVRCLVLHIRSHWQAITQHTGLSLADLLAAENLADEITITRAQREVRPKAVAEAALVRKQMYTLVFRSVDSVKRALMTLRVPNAGEYLPTEGMYAGRGRRTDLERKRAAERGEDEEKVER